MPSKLKKAIGAVKDRTSIRLAKVSSNASSELEVAVLKATTHEVVPINDRHVAEVLHLVSSNKDNAAACARAIGKRIGRTRNWVVALKSLMLVLRIFQDGDPYFPREVLHAMKRGSKILNLSSFRDDSNSSPWDYTSFVRTFALYLDERLDCFLTGKLQRRYTPDGPSSSYKPTSSSGPVRSSKEPVWDMKPAMLLDNISCLQRLLDRAIATRPAGAAKTNNLVHISLHAIVQESIDIYRDISDGLAVVLDCFFHLQYQNCVTTFHTCIKAVKQFDELSGFYSLCKDMGIGRNSEYPSIEMISEEVIESLREFLKDQSTYSSNGSNTSNRQLMICAAPTPDVEPRHREQGSQGASSELSVTTDRLSDKAKGDCTSLEELISATETWKGPSISIDLETYPASQQEDEFGVTETSSSRSLPASSSITDLMSMGWTEEEHEIKEPDQTEKKETGTMDSFAPENWELVLAETISSSSPPPPANSSEPRSDNNADTFNAFPEQLSPALAGHRQPDEQQHNEKMALDSAASKNWELVLAETMSSSPPPPPPDNNANTYDAFPEQLSPTLLDHHQPDEQEQNEKVTVDSAASKNWELALAETISTPTSSGPPSGNNPNAFDTFAEQPPEAEENSSTTTNGLQLALFEVVPPQQDSTPDMQFAPSNHYNPFLEDPLELPEATSSQQSPLSRPTFQATPTFSAQNTDQTPSPMQNENDPFGSCAEFSSEQATPTFSAQSTNQTPSPMQNENDPFGSCAEFSSEQTSTNQQDLLQQQELWLQNQNKIIAKHWS